MTGYITIVDEDGTYAWRPSSNMDKLLANHAIIENMGFETVRNYEIPENTDPGVYNQVVSSCEELVAGEISIDDLNSRVDFLLK